MKTCPLCNQPIENNQHVVAILGAKFITKEPAGTYDLEVTRQAILSHVVCPGSVQ